MANHSPYDGKPEEPDQKAYHRPPRYQARGSTEGGWIAAQRACHAGGRQHEQHACYPFARNDNVITKVPDDRYGNGAPHKSIVWKCRVHAEDMTYELVVGIIIGDVVEHHDQAKAAKGRNHDSLGQAFAINAGHVCSIPRHAWNYGFRQLASHYRPDGAGMTSIAYRNDYAIWRQTGFRPVLFRL